MKKVTIFLIAIIIAACQGTDKKETQTGKQESAERSGKTEDIQLKDFHSENYNFAVEYPESWSAVQASTGNKQDIINFFPESDKSHIDIPITIHAPGEVSFIGFYPNGYATELPMGKSAELSNDDVPVNIEINPESQKFMLENGEVWGWFIKPANPPSNWDEHGFIFAQIGVNDFNTKCFDSETGEELNMEECDPMMGDTIKRYGHIKENAANLLKQSLKSIRFSATNGQNQNNQEFSDEIRVEQPSKNAVITSPLQIKGEARGSWYFEAEFPIELIYNGETLTTAIAKAKGSWMTSDFVPFTANMEFGGIPPGEKAYLLFKNSNASGKPELDKSFRIPVTIGSE